MRRTITSFAILCVIFVVGALPGSAEEQKVKDVADYLQNVAVTIGTSSGTGSGFYKVTKDGQVWIWTAGHVVAGNRSTREITDSHGVHKTLVEFSDVYVIRQDVEDGETVGDYRLKAEVIRYSDAETGDDLALLRLRGKKLKPADSTIFYTDKSLPKLGSDVRHCGSLLGQFGANSITGGLYSQHGRMLFGKVFDQVQCTSFPGSSGGIVCEAQTGKCLGMVVRGAGEGFTLIVPIRRMRTWANRVGVGFAIDDEIAVPDDATLRNPGIDADGGASVEMLPPPKGFESGEDFPFKLAPALKYWR